MFESAASVQRKCMCAFECCCSVNAGVCHGVTSYPHVRGYGLRLARPWISTAVWWTWLRTEAKFGKGRGDPHAHH